MKTNYARKQLLKSFLMLIFAGVFISGLNAQVSGDFRSKNSGDYHDSNNWETYNGTTWGNAGTAPGSTNNVTIQATHEMTLDNAPAQQYCKNLTIEATGKLSTSVSGIYLYSYGDLQINGTLGAASGTDHTYIYQLASCTISGSGTIRFATLQIGAAINVIIDTDVTLISTGLYTYQSGNVTITQNKHYTGSLYNYESDPCTVSLTIKGKVSTSSITGYGTADNQADLIIFSDENGTGQLLHNALSGTHATLQRYIAGHGDATGASKAGWHLFASPVDDFDWSGTAWNPATSGNKDDLFGWDEVNYEWSNGRDWATKSFEKEKGYLVAYQTTTTQQVSGTMNVSDVSVDLTYTSGQGEGWNLLGNPFTCALDWDGFTIPTGVDPTVYVYDDDDDDSPQYISYNKNTFAGGLTDGIIPVTNGFFVKATQANVSFTIPKDARTLSPTTNFYKSQNENVLKLQLSNGTNTNQTTFCLIDGATSAFDNAYDAYNISSLANVPEVYFIGSDGVEIDVFASNEIQADIALDIPTEGLYSLSFEGANSFEEELYITDLKTNVQYEITEAYVHEFTASPNDETIRFKLTAKAATGIPEQAAQKLDVLYNGQELIFGQTPDIATLEVFDLSGRKIHTQQIQGQNRIALKLPNGVYIVRLYDTEGNFKSSKINSTR